MTIKEAIRRPLILENSIQEYRWGSHTAIQQLMGKMQTDAPWAELWMGAHPKAPSRVNIDGKWIGLDALIRQFPDEILGAAAASRFNNTLPFLFKILAADEPLSLQVHPDQTRARSGFARENALGIPIGDPARNYRDPSHKPECLCALTPFTVLKGFRGIDEIHSILKRLCPHGFASLIQETATPVSKNLKYVYDNEKQPVDHAVRQFYALLLALPTYQKTAIIAEAAKNARQDAAGDPICAWVDRLYQYYPEDIGILAPALMNLITLTPGQALFLESGELHAYLQGMGIEIMANSDNVLRGGLTVKHMDTNELLSVVRFDSTPIEILIPEAMAPNEFRYPVQTEEFVLSMIDIDKSITYSAPADRSVEMLLCTRGNARLVYPGPGGEITLRPGGSVIAPAISGPYQLTGAARIYKAGVPGWFRGV
jgi:mannose-6-phosphate isomerase